MDTLELQIAYLYVNMLEGKLIQISNVEGLLGMSSVEFICAGARITAKQFGIRDYGAGL